MKFLFNDEAFSFETLRTAGFAAYGGAHLGEVLASAGHIGEGDEAGWHQAWKATDGIHDFHAAFAGSLPPFIGSWIEEGPENDQYLQGQPQLVEKALTLTGDEGAGEHTHAGGLGRAHQTMFDWLDTTLTASSAPRTAVGASTN